MLAVPLDEDAARERLGSDLSLAAVNGPERCVVAGPEPPVAAFQRKLEAEGRTCRRLHTSHAFHSAAMDAVVDEFRRAVAAVPLQAPRLPFASNLTGRLIRPEEATAPDYWARHLRATVRFGDGLAAVLDRWPGLLLEVGPGHGLSALTELHPAAGGEQLALPCLRRGAEDGELASLLRTVGTFWLAGGKVDLAALHGEGRRKVPLPGYPFERRRYWIEAEPEPSPAGALERTIEKQLALMADQLALAAERSTHG